MAAHASTAVRRRPGTGLVAGALVAWVLSGCAEEVQNVTPAQLVAQQRTYDGRRVRTTGVLYSYTQPRHFWVADVDDHRVELITEKDLAPLLGLRLTVSGRFRYAETRGRRIEVETIEIARQSQR